MTMQIEADSQPETQPKRARRKGPYKAADGRRQAILDAAIEHFAQWGYFNSSIPKIAAAVGMTKAGLIHHFGSKEALLSAVLELREQRSLRIFYSADTHNDPLEYFRQIAAQAAYNERENALTQMFCVLAAEASNEKHPAHEYFRDRYENIVRGSSEILAGMVEAGTIRPDTDVRQVASEILAVVDGFTVQWALAGPPVSLADRVTSYLDRLAKSVTPDGRGISN